jgi:hypothetical protein
MLIGTAGVAYSASDSVAHEIEVGVGRVSMLEVQKDWQVRSTSVRDDGAREVHLATSYGVTCNVPDSTIQAHLASQLPTGVDVQVRMNSNVGTSEGWRDLSGDSPVVVARDPRGAEYGEVEVVVLVSGDAELASLNLDLSFSIQ